MSSLIKPQYMRERQDRVYLEIEITVYSLRDSAAPDGSGDQQKQKQLNYIFKTMWQGHPGWWQHFHAAP